LRQSSPVSSRHRRRSETHETHLNFFSLAHFDLGKPLILERDLGIKLWEAYLVHDLPSYAPVDTALPVDPVASRATMDTLYVVAAGRRGNVGQA